MKTLDELKCFAEGYHANINSTDDAPHTDDWVIWGGYDINFTGFCYAPELAEKDLLVNAYLDGWNDTEGLPQPIHTFTVGETK